MSQESNCPHVEYMDYEDTGYFSKIALDYILQAPGLKPFFAHPVSAQGIEAAIAARKNFPMAFRERLTTQLEKLYKKDSEVSEAWENIQALKSPDCFTVTTAHQPNIFGGPLYLVYKILHVIQLADSLNEKYTDQHFVPVYYMGSEDADLDELNHIEVEGKRYVWNTKQTGAVGRMRVDDHLLALIEELSGQIGISSQGAGFVHLLKEAYRKGVQIQEATFTFIHSLFGRFGLIILQPDNAELKRLFEPVIIKEIKEQFSSKALVPVAAAIEKAGYKAQTHGRPINLFYLTEDRRERIELADNEFTVPALGLAFTEDAILAEVKQYPERFSGNVVLRGPFQETILPNIIFVGGGGELAYWLEMKGVYDAVQLPYPVLLLRNSFTLITEKETELLNKLDITAAELFQEPFQILNLLVQKRKQQVSLEPAFRDLEKVYEQIQQQALLTDPTLGIHVAALRSAALKKAQGLAVKLDRAQRKKLEVESRHIQQLKSRLFPYNNLQERVENLASFYASFGPILLDIIKAKSGTIESKYGLLYL
ncbi:MAG TPA: bacillithiol biosynthesis cysteine-adding enzyme BshC [Arachidicoccus sp.]|nr:bacillithiol biosynthesis cysteine-adding enzyme BshC [Arachidicoccus sp.]